MRAARRVMRLTATALTLCVMGASAALAQQAPSKTEDEHSQHHPQAPQAQPAPPPAPASGSATPRSGGMMGGDMGRMMQMMQMMHGGMAAQPGGMRGGMMPRFHRVEGQLAYFRAELRITEAQTPQWTAFADVVRAQTERLRQGAMQEMQGMQRMQGMQGMQGTQGMQGMQSGAAQPVPAPQQMERRIASLSTHLEAMRALAAAAAPLYAALSDEQRRTADELMAEHFRSMPMGMR